VNIAPVLSVVGAGFSLALRLAPPTPSAALLSCSDAGLALRPSPEVFSFVVEIGFRPLWEAKFPEQTKGEHLMATSDKKTPPLHKIRIGAIQADIWQVIPEKGHSFLTVSSHARTNRASNGKPGILSKHMNWKL